PSLSITRRPPTSTLFPYTTLFRSLPTLLRFPSLIVPIGVKLENHLSRNLLPFNHITVKFDFCYITVARGRIIVYVAVALLVGNGDRKSTRLNSSHVKISYAVFCLK